MCQGQCFFVSGLVLSRLVPSSGLSLLFLVVVSQAFHGVFTLQGCSALGVSMILFSCGLGCLSFGELFLVVQLWLEVPRSGARRVPYLFLSQPSISTPLVFNSTV